ncbi:MAG TPA: helix-turn-helix domain-containing protein [Chloroflexia bacterium]|jgi:transposase|nr:helix-turn-helix domain-containing protein [Chloroflexia bacterium]
MPKLTKIRQMTQQEINQIKGLAHSRTAPAGLVQRAQIILLSKEGTRVTEVAAQLRVCGRTVRRWIYRFNEQGLDGLRDNNREGRPPTYTEEQRSEVVAASLTDPQSLGLPFGSWTLDRLEAYLNEHKSIPIKRSRISDILVAEGLRWRTQERWFTEKAELDPAFAEKRGPSSPSTHSHLRILKG